MITMSMKLHLKSQNNNNGFTLVELMIVLAILAIVATFAVPAYQTWIANTKTRTATESIQNGVRLAQAEAVKRGVQVQFVLTDDEPTAIDVTPKATGKNWIIQSMQLATPADTDAFIQGAAMTTQSGNSLVSADAASITFNSIGRIVSPSKLVTYTITNSTNGDRTLKVIVSVSGKVRMCDDDLDLSSNPFGCD